MTFTVTYRSADGALHTEVMEASGRTECLAQMRARGVTPTGVKEGAGNLARRNAAPNPGGGKGEARAISAQGGAKRMADGGAGAKSPSIAVRRLLAAACAALLAAGGVWWWIHGRTGDEESVRPKIERSAQTHLVPSPRNQAAMKPVPAHVATNTPPKANANGKEIVSSSVRTNANGTVIERIVLADGTKKTKVMPPPPIFDNACDQVISLAINVKPGEAMPPLPDLKGIDDDFAKSFLSPIKIKEEDPESVKELKRRVIETKKYLLEQVKNGKSVMEALLAHQAEMGRIEESRLLAIREMQRLGTEEGLEMAQAFARKVNEDFKGRGIPEIPVIGTHGEKSRRKSE